MGFLRIDQFLEYGIRFRLLNQIGDFPFRHLEQLDSLKPGEESRMGLQLHSRFNCQMGAAGLNVHKCPLSLGVEQKNIKAFS